MTDAQTEARAIVSAALPPHEQAMLGGDAIVVLADLIATALAAKDAELNELRAQLAEARKALGENAKLRRILDEQIKSEFDARQELKRIQASDDWHYQGRPIVQIAKDASCFEEALMVIAGTHWERVGYCQSDVEDVPDLTAIEAQSHARAALQRALASRRALEAQGGENG